MEAIFLLAGYEITGLKMIPNGYDGRPSSPWWKVSTTHGDFVIGWRKRVIEIDWSAIGPQPPITSDEVTKSDTLIHAWSYGRAVGYLGALRSEHLDRLLSLPNPLPDDIRDAAIRLFEANDESGRRITVRRDVDHMKLTWPDLMATEQAIYLHRALHANERVARHADLP